MKLNESVENYLETLYLLTQRLEQVKSIDVAKEMQFSKPSVSIAMKNLREKSLITIDTQGYIYLTPLGLSVATRTYERHTFLCHWLINLGVSKEIAEIDACKIEHVLSEESFQALKNYCSIK